MMQRSFWCQTRPVVTQFFPWEGGNADKLPDWLVGLATHDKARNVLTVRCRGGHVLAGPGDVIVRHPEGDHLALNRDTFTRDYEPAPDREQERLNREAAAREAEEKAKREAEQKRIEEDRAAQKQREEEQLAKEKAEQQQRERPGERDPASPETTVAESGTAAAGGAAGGVGEGNAASGETGDTAKPGKAKTKG